MSMFNARFSEMETQYETTEDYLSCNPLTCVETVLDHSNSARSSTNEQSESNTNVQYMKKKIVLQTVTEKNTNTSSRSRSICNFDLVDDFLSDITYPENPLNFTLNSDANAKSISTSSTCAESDSVLDFHAKYKQTNEYDHASSLLRHAKTATVNNKVESHASTSNIEGHCSNDAAIGLENAQNSHFNEKFNCSDIRLDHAPSSSSRQLSVSSLISTNVKEFYRHGAGLSSMNSLVKVTRESCSVSSPETVRTDTETVRKFLTKLTSESLRHHQVPSTQYSSAFVASVDASTDASETDPDTGAGCTDTEFDEHISEVVLSLCWGQEKLGAAFYHINTGQAYVVEDKAEAPPEFWLLQTLFRELQPWQVVVGGRQDERFHSALRDLCRSVTMRARDRTASPGTPSSCASLNICTTACHLNFRPASDFKYVRCRQRLQQMRLPHPDAAPTLEEFAAGGGAADGPDAAGGAGEDEECRQAALLSAVLDVQGSVAATRALGGLLRFLDHHGSELLPADLLLEGVPVLGLHSYTVESLCYLDAGSVSALQLLAEDEHPAASKAGKAAASKEGLSLLSLLSRTSSPLALPVLRRMLLRPVCCPITLQRRYAALHWAMQPQHAETVAQMTQCLRNITNVQHVVSLLQRASLEPRDWRSLYRTLFNALLLGELCRRSSVHVLKKVGDCLTDGLYQSAFLIQRILDFDQSEREARFVVKAGVDGDLDTKKRSFQGVSGIMRQVAQLELHQLPEQVDSCCIIYLPHVGYLLALPHAGLTDLPAHLQFMFSTSDMMLYKSDMCKALDVKLGDLQVDIANHETRIMLRLVETLLGHTGALTRLIDRALLLDVLLSFATVSREQGWVRPSLHGVPSLHMVAARHPLHQLCCTQHFVPNNVHSGPVGSTERTDILSGGDPADRDADALLCKNVAIVTGPNGSGKTVYLKMIGVVVVLAQVGCYVPAASMRFRPFNALLTVTKATPSVTSSFSAFMLELSRLSRAVHESRSHSLVLIDEFGAGTYEGDGAALLLAALHHWLDMVDKDRLDMVARGMDCTVGRQHNQVEPSGRGGRGDAQQGSGSVRCRSKTVEDWREVDLRAQVTVHQQKELATDQQLDCRQNTHHRVGLTSGKSEGGRGRAVEPRQGSGLTATNVNNAPVMGRTQRNTKVNARVQRLTFQPLDGTYVGSGDESASDDGTVVWKSSASDSEGCTAPLQSSEGECRPLHGTVVVSRYETDVTDHQGDERNDDDDDEDDAASVVFSRSKAKRARFWIPLDSDKQVPPEKGNRGNGTVGGVEQTVLMVSGGDSGVGRDNSVERRDGVCGASMATDDSNEEVDEEAQRSVNKRAMLTRSRKGGASNDTTPGEQSSTSARTSQQQSGPSFGETSSKMPSHTDTGKRMRLAQRHIQGSHSSSSDIEGAEATNSRVKGGSGLCSSRSSAVDLGTGHSSPNDRYGKCGANDLPKTNNCSSDGINKPRSKSTKTAARTGSSSHGDMGSRASDVVTDIDGSEDTGRSNSSNCDRGGNSRGDEENDNGDEGMAVGAPHVFVSTHLLTLHDLVSRPDAVAHLVLQTVVTDYGELVPLYQVCEGRTLRSEAGKVALAAGLPVAVVERAEEVEAYISRGGVPPAWPPLCPPSLRRLCSSVVSLLLRHDAGSGSTAALLHSVRDVAQQHRREMENSRDVSRDGTDSSSDRSRRPCRQKQRHTPTTSSTTTVPSDNNHRDNNNSSRSNTSSAATGAGTVNNTRCRPGACATV